MDGIANGLHARKIREMLEAREQKTAPVGLMLLGLRTELGMTQQEMAYILNTGIDTIRRMEAGQPLTNERIIARIASLMGMVRRGEI